MIKFETAFSGVFNKAMIAVLFLLIGTNGYLYLSNKIKEQKIINRDEIIKQEKTANRLLSTQLANVQQQITQYQEQVKKLNDNLLTHLHQAEKRTDEIKQALQDESWSGQPVPNRIIRLFNERTHQINRANPATLPDRSTMPKTDNNTKK